MLADANMKRRHPGYHFFSKLFFKLGTALFMAARSTNVQAR